ncbi:CaiB/BaiF CoA transferase family protein [Pseudorhodoferax sp.]|uniref:CaiB/BaiF CoA transferase family protein n=1 Tax=Pseudorhodoferax sp. TaxID=1993553 RepID=UPI002DD6205D|nr:CoA transferase [Pseudorhodoferax sp.]
MQVLKGIRVLDLGRFIAGPFCAALLADYGADVIRVDKVGGSEDRHIVPVSDLGDGALFLQVNRNKRSLSLDIDSDEGRAVLRGLIAQADIVVANMPARALQNLGLDYESLCKIRPDVILVASSAFGSTPALRDRVGFDGVGQAVSGAVHLTGLADQPMKMMVPVVDFGTGMACAFGAMMALYERRSSGRGQEVGASLLQTALNFSSGALIEEAVLQPGRQATGNRAPHYAPSDIFRVQDGWIIVQVIGPAMFKRWARLVGRPELLEDPRMGDDIARGENGEALSGVMSAWCAGLTRAQALALLEQARIPAGPVQSPREVLDDAAIREAGAFHPLAYPGAPREVPLVSPPSMLSRTPPAIARRAPLAGEHTDAILAEQGYSAQEIAGLRGRGVV